MVPSQFRSSIDEINLQVSWRRAPLTGCSDVLLQLRWLPADQSSGGLAMELPGGIRTLPAAHVAAVAPSLAAALQQVASRYDVTCRPLDMNWYIAVVARFERRR